MFDRIKINLLYKELKGKPKNSVEKISLYDASRIGILALKEDSQKMETIRDFIEQLRKEGKHVTTLFYEKNKREETDTMQGILNRKDLNWYNKPSEEKIKEFTGNAFDLIINFDLSDFKPFHYIAANSVGYKIAFNDKYNTLTYDFIIKCNNITPSNLIKNLKLYLT